MAHRHRVHKHHKAHGGRTVYAGAGSHVVKEAEEHKRGGHVHHHLGKTHGHKGKHRLDKRARGGGIGSDKSPFSTAAHGMSGHGPDHGAAAHHEHRGKVQGSHMRHGGHTPHPTMHKSHGHHRGHHVKGG